MGYLYFEQVLLLWPFIWLGPQIRTFISSSFLYFDSLKQYRARKLTMIAPHLCRASRAYLLPFWVPSTAVDVCTSLRSSVIPVESQVAPAVLDPVQRKIASILYKNIFPLVVLSSAVPHSAYIDVFPRQHRQLGSRIFSSEHCDLFPRDNRIKFVRHGTWELVFDW